VRFEVLPGVTLKKEATGSSKSFVTVYQTARYHILKDSNLNGFIWLRRVYNGVLL
jgi:hypothetical protein